MLTRDDIVSSYLGHSEFEDLKSGSANNEQGAIRRRDYIHGVVHSLLQGEAMIDFSRDRALVPMPLGENDKELYGENIMKICECSPNEVTIDENQQVTYNISPYRTMYMTPQEARSHYFDQCEKAVQSSTPEYAVPVHATPVALQVLQGAYEFDYSRFDELFDNHETIAESLEDAEAMKHALQHMLYKEPTNPFFAGSVIGVQPMLEALAHGQYKVSVDADNFDSIISDMSDEQFNEFRAGYERYYQGLDSSIDVPVATDALMMDENMNYSGLTKQKYTYGFPLDQDKSPWVDCQFGLSDDPYDVIERADLSIYTSAEQAEIAMYRETDNIDAAKQVADTLNQQAKTQVTYQLTEMERQNRMQDGFGSSMDFDSDSFDPWNHEQMVGTYPTVINFSDWNYPDRVYVDTDRHDMETSPLVEDLRVRPDVSDVVGISFSEMFGHGRDFDGDAPKPGSAWQPGVKLSDHGLSGDVDTRQQMTMANMSFDDGSRERVSIPTDLNNWSSEHNAYSNGLGDTPVPGDDTEEGLLL